MKLDAKEILIEARKFYKVNFKKLTVFSVIMFLYILLFAISKYCNAVFPKTPLSISFAVLIVTVSIITYPKYILAVQIYINNMFSDKHGSFIKAYQAAKGKYWTSVKFFFISILIMLIPILALQNIPFSSLYLIPVTAVFNTIFFLVLPVISLENNNKRFLSKSIKLIKGNFINILVLELLINTIFLLPYNFLTAIYAGKAPELLVLSSIYALIRFFVSPFANTVCIIVYKKIAGDEFTQEADLEWDITDENSQKHTIAFKSMKFFGNIKLNIDGEVKEFTPRIIKKTGWVVSLNIFDKDLLLMIPFKGTDIDLSVNGIFLNSNLPLDTGCIINADEGEYAVLRNKVKRGFSSFFTMIMLTYLNIILLSINASVSFPFSAFFPSVLAGIAFSLYNQEGNITIFAIIAIFAVIFTSIFLWLYFLSKKHFYPLWIALILFILDTGVLIYMCMDNMTSALVDIAFHIWVIHALTGLIKSKMDWNQKVES